MPDELSPRHLALRVAEVSAVVAVVAIAITSLPALDQGRARLQHADPGWIVALALAALLAAGSPSLLRARGERGAGRWGLGLRGGVKAAADGGEQAILLLRSYSRGVIVGSFAYMAFDIVALGFAFAAIGPVPAIGT